MSGILPKETTHGTIPGNETEITVFMTQRYCTTKDGRQKPNAVGGKHCSHSAERAQGVEEGEGKLKM